MQYRFSFLLCFIIFVNTGFSQVQVDKAKQLLKANRIIEAKTTIDQFLKDPVNQKNAGGFYAKAKIYTAISEDARLMMQYPSSRIEAFKAIKTYIEYDQKQLIELQIEGFKPLNDLYTGFYQHGANSFNSKNYQSAYENFVYTISVSSFMTKKGWLNVPLDTNAVLYAGVSAEKLGRYDEAVKYYCQLVDGRARGEGFVEIYKWVANNYYEKKNTVLATKYLGIGRATYPEDPFWNSLEIDLTRNSGNKDALFAQYEKTIAAEPTNHLYRYNYAVELYQEGYHTDPAKRPLKSDELLQKATFQISKAIVIKPDYAKAQLLAGQITYNIGVDLLGKLKTAQPAEVSNLKAKALGSFEQAIPYFLAVERLLGGQEKLTVEEKSDLKEAYDLLMIINEQKGDQEKVKAYEAKLQTL